MLSPLDACSEMPRGNFTTIVVGLRKENIRALKIRKLSPELFCFVGILREPRRQKIRNSYTSSKGKGSAYSIAERGVLELIPVLGSQPAVDVSHKPGGRLPLLSARPAVTPATLDRGCCQFRCLVNRCTTGVNSLPKTVTRRRRGCDLNQGPSAPESSALTTRLPSHENLRVEGKKVGKGMGETWVKR